MDTSVCTPLHPHPNKGADHAHPPQHLPAAMHLTPGCCGPRVPETQVHLNTAARNTLMWHCGKCFHFHSARSGVAGVRAAVPLCWAQLSGAAVHVAAPPQQRGQGEYSQWPGQAGLLSWGGEVSDLGLPWPPWPHRPQDTSFSCPLMSLLGSDGPGPLLWHPCSLPSHLK